MPVTFEVSPVEVATEPLPTRPFKQAFERRLGSPVEACGGSAATLVDGPSEHPFLATVRLAFDRHYPLVLRPDDVWLLLAQGFGQHLRKNAEALRERIVAHQGQVEITIRRDDFVAGSPENAWPEVFDAFSDEIARVIGKKRDLIVADFSTTGPAEKAASQIVLMDAMRSFFRYAVLTLCGIPRITLLGTPADWAKLRRRASYFSELGLEAWVAALDPVLDQLSRAAGGRADPDFWRSFFKTHDASGGEQITGWINVFFPYLVREDSGQLLENGFARGGPKKAGFREGPVATQFPSGLSTAPFRWQYYERQLAMELVGGFAGTSQDPGTLALRPEIAWAVRPAGAARGGRVDLAVLGPGGPLLESLLEQVRVARGATWASERWFDVEVEGVTVRVHAGPPPGEAVPAAVWIVLAQDADAGWVGVCEEVERRLQAAGRLESTPAALFHRPQTGAPLFKMIHALPPPVKRTLERVGQLHDVGKAVEQFEALLGVIARHRIR